MRKLCIFFFLYGKPNCKKASRNVLILEPELQHQISGANSAVGLSKSNIDLQATDKNGQCYNQFLVSE
jgi:hypothetical protein